MTFRGPAGPWKTPLKTPHLTEELRIQEPEFRRRRAQRAIPDPDFWILGSQKFTPCAIDVCPDQPAAYDRPGV